MKSLKIQLKTQMHSLKIQNKKRKRRAWPLNHWVWKIKTLRIIFVHEINTWISAKTRYGYVNLKNTGLNQAFVVKTDQNDAENASERPVSPQITQNVRREKLRGENQQGKNATKMKTKTFPGCFRARKMPKNVQKILTRSKRLKMRCEAGFFLFLGNVDSLPSSPAAPTITFKLPLDTKWRRFTGWKGKRRPPPLIGLPLPLRPERLCYDWLRWLPLYNMTTSVAVLTQRHVANVHLFMCARSISFPLGCLHFLNVYCCYSILAITGTFCKNKSFHCDIFWHIFFYFTALRPKLKKKKENSSRI